MGSGICHPFAAGDAVRLSHTFSLCLLLQTRQGAAPTPCSLFWGAGARLAAEVLAGGVSGSQGWRAPCSQLPSSRGVGALLFHCSFVPCCRKHSSVPARKPLPAGGSPGVPWPWRCGVQGGMCPMEGRRVSLSPTAAQPRPRSPCPRARLRTGVAHGARARWEPSLAPRNASDQRGAGPPASASLSLPLALGCR